MRYVVKKRLLISVALIASIALVGGLAWADEESDSTVLQKPDSLSKEQAAPPSDRIIAYYFYGNRRCATCRKLEAYSEEALLTGFESELADSSLVWRAVNYDEKENKHYIKDYQLYTKTLILSREGDAKEGEWKNLDKIWELVRYKDKFIKYVQSETRTFMNPGNDK